MPDELRILRDRVAALGGSFDNAQGGDGAFAGAAMLCQTTQVDSYPTAAAAMYAVVPCDVDGPEVEGGAATYVPRAGAIALAWNAGSQPIPKGTTLVAHAVGGRLVVRYDG